MSSLDQLVWEHKYRPKTVEDTILPVTTKQMIQGFISTGNIPNMLFAGSAGVGKTTVAYAIANEIGADVLFINASLEGNIDTLRTKITQFVSTVSFTDSKKMVIMDEADHLTNVVQAAFRGFLDSFSDNAVFVFTCNYPNRIIDPLQSRLAAVNFKFDKSDKVAACSQMLKRAKFILDTEKIEYDVKAVGALVARNFPDFRRTVVDLQRYSIGGTIDSGVVAISDESGINELVDYIKGKEYNKCRQWVANNQLDGSTFYRMFYDKVTSKVVPQSLPQLIMFIGEYQDRASFHVDLEINQMCFITEVMKGCQFT